MGRSHADKERRRTERLEPLPSTEKALKIAQIKRKEGRILNADERHAVKMQGPVGASLKLCEVVRCKTTTKEDRAAAIEAFTHGTVFQFTEQYHIAELVIGVVAGSTHPEHLSTDNCAVGLTPCVVDILCRCRASIWPLST